jgi:hypothetical protein
VFSSRELLSAERLETRSFLPQGNYCDLENVGQNRAGKWRRGERGESRDPTLRLLGARVCL